MTTPFLLFLSCQFCPVKYRKPEERKRNKKKQKIPLHSPKLSDAKNCV